MRSKSQKEAQKRYVKKHYRLEVLLPIGAEQKLKEHAEMLGMSVSQFTNRALQLTIKQDRKIMEEQKRNNDMRMHKPAKKTDT